MKYLIGVDLGTSATKTVLFDESGNIITSSIKEYPLYQEKNGWAEQDANDWWEAACITIKDVILKSGINNHDIVGLGLSGQMHGLVMLDKNGNLLRKSIIWCDQRTAKECEEITRKVGKEKLIQITANPALTGFTASKILWVRNNEPLVYENCAHILLPKDYVRYKLTGEFATEVSDASGMQLLDIKNRKWSDEVLKKLNIDKSMLAAVYESPEITGCINSFASSLTGLAEGTPVAGGAGDNAAAAIGTGTVIDKRAFTTLGTSGVVFAHTSSLHIDSKGRVHTFCAAVPNEWHVMGVTQAAGLSLKWFRNNFYADKSYKELDAIAEKIPIGAERLLFLPYLMGERTPHLDPDCRAAFIGLSAIHTKEHMLRAVLEGVSYSQKDSLEVLREMGIEIEEMLACGGGGSSPLWRQMLSDIYNCPVKTSASTESAALGAAILAGVGTGLYSSVQEACAAIVKTQQTYQPVKENNLKYEKFYKVYKDLYSSLKDSYQALKSL